MKNSILNIRSSSQAKVVINNFISLFVLQGANYLLPLLTVPYLTRVLGPGNFGIAGITAAFATYFNILIDYGFNLSATKEISINKDNQNKISRIFSSVTVIKFSLLLLSVLIYFVSVEIFSVLKIYAPYYFMTFGIVLGNTLFPTYIYQGMEKMKYITIFNLSARLAFTILVFMLIKSRSDLMIYIGINSVTMIFIGIVSFITAMKIFKLTFVMPSFQEIHHQAKEGWLIFISSIGIVVYSASTTFILGLLTNNTIAGYFSSADKIRQALQGLLTPLFQAVYPYVGKLAVQSKKSALKFLKLELLGVSIIGLLIAILTIAKADLIVHVFLGDEYQNSVGILKILAFMPLLVGIANVLTIQTMLSFNLNKAYSRIYISTSILGIGLIILLTWLWGAPGTALSIAVIEILVLVSALFHLIKNKIWIN